MTAINTILDNNWDTDICTKPTIITLKTGNFRAYQRVIGTQLADFDDEVVGIQTRQYYNEDSHDIYICKAASMTSEADLRNMIKAVKKICATYTPTSAENILEWQRGSFMEFNGVRWYCEFALIVRKAGIAAY